ncbi:uncharacterized protein LOC134277014 [Saccostrea cucullata]|uniref:uncharacterized protein LOC134277014 n=1 Tax=Saccostrea cuccullata TaxID=36930 RepID=UPI002ED268F2
MTDVRFEGLLQKPGRIPGRKTKVWGVLDGKELFFYRENKRSSCIGSLDLSLVRKIEKVVPTGSEFLIDYDGRYALYTAENSVKCDEWITYITQATQSPGKSNQLPIAGQTNATETFKHKKTNDTTASIKSRTETLQPSENNSGRQITVNKPFPVQREVQNKPRVSDKPQKRPFSYKKEDIDRSSDKLVNLKCVETVQKNVPAKDVNFTKLNSLLKEAGKESVDQTPKNCVTKVCKENVAKEVFRSNLNVKTEAKCDSRKPEIAKSLKNSITDNINTRKTDIKANLGNRRSSSLPQTEEDTSTRPDSGYETLAGSDNRKSVITEEYGEVDISSVVLRKSRRSILSSTMINPESELPNMESGSILRVPKETNCKVSDKDSSCASTLEEKCMKKDKSLLSNGDIHKDKNSELDDVYENVNTARVEIKEENNSEEAEEEEEGDYVVPRRRNIVSKRSTMVDVHVPQVVIEADEDNENDDYTQPSSEGGLLTEEQEDLLINLTFEPIEDLPFKSDNLQHDKLDFSEIQGFVKGSKFQSRSLVSSGKNPVESLRQLLDKL